MTVNTKLKPHLTAPPPQPLQIKSVVAPDHVKGYIYVESYKQTHVKAAIEGIGNLRMGLWNQQMVPIKEMTDVLKVVKEVTNLKPKSWVRLKRGLYKDDIAQVRWARTLDVKSNVDARLQDLAPLHCRTAYPGKPRTDPSRNKTKGLVTKAL